MRRHQPAYYLPGLISLFLLPLFFLLELRQRGVFREYTMLKVYWQRASANEKSPFLKPPPARDFQKHLFTGNPAHDGYLLDQLEHRFKNMLEQQDTIRGIHIQFGPECRYQIFISALDKLYAQKKWYSQFSEEGIKAWYQTPPDTSKDILIKPLLFGCVMPDAEKEKKCKAEQEAIFQQFFMDLAVPLWPSALLWILLALLALRRRLRR